MTNVFQEDATGRKATSILNDGRIHRIDGADTFYVEGSTGRYVVVLDSDRAFCSCPSTVAACSHVRAAMRLRALEAKPTDADSDPFAGLGIGR